MVAIRCLEASKLLLYLQMGVSKNSGFPPKSSILIGFSIINHPFWGTPSFGNSQMVSRIDGIQTAEKSMENTAGFQLWMNQLFPTWWLNQAIW